LMQGIVRRYERALVLVATPIDLSKKQNHRAGSWMSHLAGNRYHHLLGERRTA
jgi:hypothetical protein